MRFVMIEWEDSHTIEGWQHLDGPLDDEATVCRSVGWLVLDGEHVKTIAPHIAIPEPEQACGIMRIPARSILRIVDLTLPDDQPTSRA